jgi:hypothetical protein
MANRRALSGRKRPAGPRASIRPRPLRNEVDVDDIVVRPIRSKIQLSGVTEHGRGFLRDKTGRQNPIVSPAESKKLCDEAFGHGLRVRSIQ